MKVLRFSSWVFAAWISALVLNEFVNRPVEMKPTASKACSRVRHLLEVLLTNSMFTPPDPSRNLARGEGTEEALSWEAPECPDKIGRTRPVDHRVAIGEDLPQGHARHGGVDLGHGRKSRVDTHR